jgi:DNA-binding NtrC family response regulator
VVGISLLIIDDNAGSLEMLSAALRREGVHILTAEDPVKALDLVREYRPQVVLTDLVMPKLSGLEVLDRIVEFDPAIDVILMTAHYSTESAVDAIKRGASDYLNKPVSLSLLRARVSALLEQAQQPLQQSGHVGHVLPDSQNSSAFQNGSDHRANGNRKRSCGADAI